MPSVLQARELRKKYGNTVALDGVSLDLHTSECIAVLGPNGAGKTTLVEILEGLRTPDAGSLTVFGLDYLTSRRAIYERVGVVLQDSSFYKKMTPLETLKLFASFYKQGADVEQIIQRLGLVDKKSDRLENLSGGQKQRVALGCALVNNPALLFLDEPTTGLDPQSRHFLWDIILEHKQRGGAVILTTHYMDEAEKLADKVLIVDAGKIIESGKPNEMITRICGNQTLRCRVQNSECLKTLVNSTTLNVDVRWDGDGLGFELTAADLLPIAHRMTQEAEAKGIAMQELTVRTNTLEDVFLKLTGRGLRHGA